MVEDLRPIMGPKMEVLRDADVVGDDSSLSSSNSDILLDIIDQGVLCINEAGMDTRRAIFEEFWRLSLQMLVKTWGFWTMIRNRHKCVKKV